MLELKTEWFRTIISTHGAGADYASELQDMADKIWADLRAKGAYECLIWLDGPGMETSESSYIDGLWLDGVVYAHGAMRDMLFHSGIHKWQQDLKMTLAGMPCRQAIRYETNYYLQEDKEKTK